jgi:hypothetical protein
MDRNEEKYDAIEFFLKKYGFVLNFYDDSYKNYKKRIKLESGDTFKTWKEKTFGNGKAEIEILCELEPANQTKFANILLDYDASEIKKLFKLLETELADTVASKKEMHNRTLSLKRAITKERHDSKFFPKEILETCLAEFMEQETEVFDKFYQVFTGYLDSIEADIEISDILKRLMKAHNVSTLALSKDDKFREQIKQKDQELKNLSKSLWEKEEKLMKFGEEIKQKNRELNDLKAKIKS